ncbi:hypothetical protein E0486_14790 [Flaviaesturariibacter aridisoli]|uniref:Uncharacterized protein n=2 Tax=Flaviaesturariibacter aridisoli TaxID=2545761 RepID=A0A4R4E101_9BACT|nr:hypothetical protein E0486_14790 [Flaviaesturariibacter aridisoli]
MLLFLLLTAAVRAGAQLPGSNGRVKTLALRTDSLQLDSLSLVPGTVQVEGVPDSLFTVDPARGLLRWKQRPAGDSVRVRYRVFPFRLGAVAQRMRYDSIRLFSYLRPFEPDDGKDPASSRGLFNFGNLQYNGSFGRGIAFGNAQDAVVNSNFNLQLSGMLADSIEIAAAITDNNMPIQPDGTTQQLNEFDQVFLQFSKKNWKLNLGDIDLRQNNLYFLNFYKRLQGVTFQTNYGLGGGSKGSTLVSCSIAKGKFFRNIIDAVSRPDLQLEGNQGPFRLHGANNEYFFIVLANSERVFLDGVLLQRGEDQDYVINYNTAEVTFTPKHLISKDSRIQIEFEYADRNFLNSNLYAFQTLDLGPKLSLKIGAFQNADAKNSSINQTIDEPQRRFLANIGDSIDQAFYPNIVFDSFARNRILYEKVYVTGGTVPDSFYRYSTDSINARYSLSFTDVGAGRGNYVPDFNGANGKVYKYVAPVNSLRQGSFEPVVRLVTPKKQQVVSMAADYRFNDRNTLHAEMGMSNYSANTFSMRDAADDRGFAGRLQYTNRARLSKARGLELTTTVDFEHEQAQFRPLERLRYVEFSREWGLPLEAVAVPADETIARLSAALQDNRKHSFSYQLMSYRRNTDYQGLQQIIQHGFVLGGWTFANELAVTAFRNSRDKGRFLRPVIDVSRTLESLRNVKLGLRYSLEDNEVRNKALDTVTATSFSFEQWTAYLKTDEARRNRYTLTFFTRSDKYPFEKGLVRGDRSYNTSFGAELLANEHHQVIFNATYRQLDVFNNKVSRQQKDRTFLGRVEYQVNELRGFVTGNLLYEVGAGQEQRRDITYYEVPPGKGEFAWNDYNGDGIQQLNEFEPAQFPDQAKWIRIFIPTTDFLKANYTTLNYSFQFTPRNLYPGSDRGRFIKRFTWQTALQKTKKGIAKGDVDFNPFKYSLQDTALITAATSLNNTLSFNRFSQKWGLDLSNLQNTGKSLLTYGYESRRLNDWLLKLRWNLSPSFTVNLNTKLGSNSLFTPSFNNRNYAISGQSTEPQLVYLRGSTFRVQAGYKLDLRRNENGYGGERSTAHSLNLDSKYSVLQNASVSTRFTYSNIDYPFAPNSTVSYIMLEGLLPGRNFLWSADFTKRLFRNIEVNLQYEGRKAGASNTVHIGRASLRALF